MNQSDKHLSLTFYDLRKCRQVFVCAYVQYHIKRGSTYVCRLNESQVRILTHGTSTVFEKPLHSLLVSTTNQISEASHQLDLLLSSSCSNKTTLVPIARQRIIILLYTIKSRKIVNIIGHLVP